LASTKVIGLIGPIGAGKSAAADILRRRGGSLLDADKVAHGVLAEEPVMRKLVRRWGPDVARNGRIRHDAVAKIVFASDDERRFLERLVHPRVIAETRRVIAHARRAKKPFVVVDAPLLIESGLDELCDFVIYVDAPRPLRLERARRLKGLDAAEVARRSRAMLPLGLKRKKATRVIRNDGGLDLLERRIERFLKDFLKQPKPEKKNRYGGR